MSESQSTVDHILQSDNLPASEAQATYEEDQIEMVIKIDTNSAASSV
jgi:hypothetical protein